MYKLYNAVYQTVVISTKVLCGICVMSVLCIWQVKTLTIVKHSRFFRGRFSVFTVKSDFESRLVRLPVMTVKYYEWNNYQPLLPTIFWCYITAHSYMFGSIKVVSVTLSEDFLVVLSLVTVMMVWKWMQNIKNNSFYSTTWFVVICTWVWH